MLVVAVEVVEMVQEIILVQAVVDLVVIILMEMVVLEQ
tara:strand:+ start:545 stop:658 length:114 start_codon:yes stop_codon:yes gene_type:complete